MSLDSELHKNNSQETMSSNLAGNTNMIVFNQNDGTYIIGEQIFSVDTLDLNAISGPMEYTNIILEESTIQLISDQNHQESVVISDNNNFDGHSESAIKNLIKDIETNLTNGFNKINKTLRKTNNNYKNLELKVDSLLNEVQSREIVRRVSFPLSEKKSGSLIVGVDSATSALNDDTNNLACDETSKGEPMMPIQDTYPDGSWLGDPNNPSKRVRCAIKEFFLNELNKMCLTPEKLALSLLDYLFDRETQAISNISGTSKLGKKQLDPIKIFGIRCHLEYIFKITNKEWKRITQNIDSKCRTAFRRKVKGMPLKVKSLKLNTSIKNQNEDNVALEAITAQLNTHEEQLQKQLISNAEFKSGNIVPISIHTADGYTFSLPAETIEHNSHVIQIHGDGNLMEIIPATSSDHFQLAGAQVLEQFENHMAAENTS